MSKNLSLKKQLPQLNLLKLLYKKNLFKIWKNRNKNKNQLLQKHQLKLLNKMRMDSSKCVLRAFPSMHMTAILKISSIKLETLSKLNYWPEMMVNLKESLSLDFLKSHLLLKLSLLMEPSIWQELLKSKKPKERRTTITTTEVETTNEQETSVPINFQPNLQRYNQTLYLLEVFPTTLLSNRLKNTLRQLEELLLLESSLTSKLERYFICYSASWIWICRILWCWNC